MAVITQIADAVVAELNAAGFSQPFEARRSYLPRFDLAEMKDLHVTVVPKAVQILPGSRNENNEDFIIYSVTAEPTDEQREPAWT